MRQYNIKPWRFQKPTGRGIKKGRVMDFRQIQKEKSLAWFKLADLIARREREKALSVFRLLAHSLPDRAYVLQIEGDILLYLDDGKNAVEKYKAAAFLYQKDKRWVDAIAVYEHLLTQSHDSVEVLSTLILSYAMVDWEEKFHERFQNLTGLMHQGVCDTESFERTVREIAGLIDPSEPKVKGWVSDWMAKSMPSFQPALQESLRGLVR